MANVNISSWTTGQVAEWLRGLGGAVDGYIAMLETRGLNGVRLLAMRCDDLEALGVQIIGHQELLLEAIEHLRNFHYELHRENVQQLSLRLSVAARSLYNELRTRHDGVKLETDTLSGVARLIAAVKPLVYWLNRAPFRSTGGLAERKRALLDLSLRAATSAQRERFAEYPMRVVTAAADAMANVADYIVQEVSDPVILQPAALSTVLIHQGDRPLDFSLAPGCGGRHYLADIRFGSPAHASGLIEHGDEIVAVGDQLVVGWGGEAILRACVVRAAAYSGDLALTLRRRPGARAAAASPLHAYRPFRRHAPAHVPVPYYHHHLWPWIHADLALFRKHICATLGENTESGVPEKNVVTAEADAAADSSDPEEADPLWPPDDLNTRMYPPKPRSLVQRRHTISGASPISKSPNMITDQFWQELRSHKNFKHTGSTHMNIGEEPDDNVNALYRRDKAVSCSTGLELSPRPKTCLGVGTAPLPAESVPPPRPRDVKQRGKLDKAHSTPAYDLGADGADGGSLVTQIIPESPTTPTESPTIFVHSAEKADQILDFKKSSSQIGEAILHQQQKRMVTTDIHKTKFTFSEMTEIGDARKHLEVDTDAEGDVENNDLLETVNIGLLEKRTNIDKPISKENSTLSIMSVTSGKGHTDDETSFEHENSVVDRSNIVEAINEQRTVVSVRTPKWRKPLVSQTESPTSPPEPPPRPVITKASHGPSPAVKEYPPLKPVSQLESLDVNELSPLKPPRLGDQLQISVPLKHITKHDIHVIPNSEASPRRELLVPLNHESTGLLEIPRLGAARSHPHLGGAELSGARVQPATSPSTSVSPTASVVRGIFPSSKSKSLKKKNSILAKRRRVSVRELGGGTWQGLVLQRVRVRQRAPGTAPVAPATPPLGDSPAGVWVRRWYVLRDNTLYGFRALDCEKADCLIFLKGFTASPAPEVKSKPFAFKVYHTGTVFYFAAETLEAMTAWLDHISRATMLCYDSWERAHKDKKVDESKHFSETDYSEGDLSDKETTEKKSEGKEKDKSKFGSLKKLTHRIHKSESQESVSSAAASLDRKYLRFFSRSKSKSKTSTPVPTEHYRSYRRVTAAGGELTRDAAAARVQLPAPAPVLDVPLVDNEPTRTQKKLPKPINYIHASNPNLLDFEKSDFVAKPNLNVPLPKAKVHKPDNFMGFVTLQEFMLKKQEEERREMYSNRVLMGVERDARTSSKRAAKELQRQWERIVPDVIYGELRSTDDDRPAPDYLRGRTLPEAPRSAPGAASAPVFARPSDGTKPVSVKDKDGYEKIVYVSDTDAICTPDYDPPQVLPRKLSKAEEDVVESRQRRHSETSDPKAGAEGSSEVRDELKRTVAPQPPPKIMPKSRHVLNRQSSLGSGVVSGGTEGLAVAQGDSPERFWRSSLRRNDRVHSRPPEARAEPKPLKSAAQYTPLSLPAPPATLATAPHLHIALDTGEVVSTASPGVSRLRQVFQGGANPEAPQPVWAGRGVQYPHLQCPPTFEPETYSLADCATSHQRHKHHA